MGELKTPFLDKEIEALEKLSEIDPVKYHFDVPTVKRLQEYQSIKETLNDFQATKKELELQKYFVDTGNKTLGQLTSDNNKLGGDLKQARHQLEEVKEALRELKSQHNKLKEAANQLHHLHLCEQEGIGSGQPTAHEWFYAVNNLGELLTPKE
jgi:DNA repair exonuclease SbcCD ATPase subunit